MEQTVTLRFVLPQESYDLLRDFMDETESTIDEALGLAVHHLLGSWLFDQQQEAHGREQSPKLG